MSREGARSRRRSRAEERVLTSQTTPYPSSSAAWPGRWARKEGRSGDCPTSRGSQASGGPGPPTDWGSLRVQRPQPRVPGPLGPAVRGLAQVQGARAPATRGPVLLPETTSFPRPAAGWCRGAGRENGQRMRPRPPLPVPAGAAGSLGCGAGCEDLRAEIGPSAGSPSLLKGRPEGHSELVPQTQAGKRLAQGTPGSERETEKGARFSLSTLKSLRQTGEEEAAAGR